MLLLASRREPVVSFIILPLRRHNWQIHLCKLEALSVVNGCLSIIKRQLGMDLLASPLLQVPYSFAGVNP